MEKFFFEKPSIERKDDAIDYINEFLAYKSDINGTGGLNKYLDNYESWLQKTKEDETRIPDEDRVPGLTYFLVRKDDNRIVGMISIRLILNEKLKRYGGNIGYSIRPTERGKGYNKINLYLALKVCQEHHLKEVMLDADLSNPASWKTMEALGGKRVREYFDDEFSHTIEVDYIIDVNKAIQEHHEFEAYILKK